MEFLRTNDYGLVRRILTWPEIYATSGDDYTVPAEDFKVYEHPDIWYVLAANGLTGFGLFTLIPENTVCWKLHVGMLPWASTEQKWAAARKLAPWLGANTPCRRLTAMVPANNRTALVYGTHGIGMHYVGTQEKAFMKGGMLQDLIILGRSVQEG